MRGRLLCGSCIVLMLGGCCRSRCSQASGQEWAAEQSGSWSGECNASCNGCPANCPTAKCHAFGYCDKLDILATKSAAKKSAGKSLKALQACTDRRFSSDFKAGYRRAYEDVLLGGSGETPPVPPKKYWNARLRTPLGVAAAEGWFTGYRLGAEAVCQDRPTPFNTLPTSLPECAYATSSGQHGMLPNHDGPYVPQQPQHLVPAPETLPPQPVAPTGYTP